MPNLKSIHFFVCDLSREEEGQALKCKLKRELPGVEIKGFERKIPRALLFYGLILDLFS